jgi:hypothetical protein
MTLQMERRVLRPRLSLFPVQAGNNNLFRAIFYFFLEEELPGATVTVGAGMIMVLLPFSFESFSDGAAASAALSGSLATFDPFFHFPGTPE